MNYKEQFPDITDKELKCLQLRDSGATYDQISRALGSPSKKWIGQTLRKYNPEAVDAKKPNKQAPKYNATYSKLYNILRQYSRGYIYTDDKYITRLWIDKDSKEIMIYKSGSPLFKGGFGYNLSWVPENECAQELNSVLDAIAFITSKMKEWENESKED